MVVVPICGPLKSPGLGPGEIDSQNVPTERRAVHSKRREEEKPTFNWRRARAL
jgi:hypothetical protein